MGGTRIVRRLEATLAVTALLLVLALSWELRPALPQLPQSFSAPLPSSTIGATLELAAWVVFVLLDLVLIRKALQFAIRRETTRTELRLRHAFAQHGLPSHDGTRDWRAYAAPLAPPVLLVPTRYDVEPVSEPVERAHEVLPQVPPEQGTPRIERPDDHAGVRLLGPFELTGCKKKQPRRQATAELLAFLAIQRRPVSRDELLEALWPGEDPRRSAARFYQAASEARKLLGNVFVRERDTYNLDPEQLRIDLDELDRLQEEARGTEEEQERPLLERAVALFRGNPLTGIDALWADSERRRLTSLHVNLLERVGRLRLKSGDAAGALEVADKAEALDGPNEHVVQLAIEAEAALGRRDAVAGRYERLCCDLDERFGLEPSRETKQLYRRLLSQDPRVTAH